MTDHTAVIDAIAAALAQAQVLPYLGPDVLPADAPVPRNALALAAGITAKTAVPHKLKTRLTGAAQYIENFKHRKTVNALMTEQFTKPIVPAPVHALVARLRVPLVVDVWYDDALLKAYAGRTDWGTVQGVSQAEHHGEWVAYYQADGTLVPAEAADAWSTLVYKPIGCVSPARNYIVSDSDYVEVLTEIDIQTPIPPRVQSIRTGRSFLFVGCRFADQLERSYARQVMKRSSSTHWAVIPGELTRNEAKFVQEQNITRIDMQTADFVAALDAALARQGAAQSA